ncbi:MAG: hypothetical protein KJ622_13215 [Alphaproteobacteria bacterium]|nr:hypothetical protein [Alphaproteobacteria bacterium]
MTVGKGTKSTVSGRLSALAPRLLGRTATGRLAAENKPRKSTNSSDTTSTFLFPTKDGSDVGVTTDLPEPIPNRPATFVFGIIKGASTLLNRMLDVVLRETGRRPVYLPNLLRRGSSNIEDSQADLDSVFEYSGVVYGGFRSFPEILRNSPTFATSNRIVMVRDPRDILVSLDFSHAYSHTVPESGVARQRAEDMRQRALRTGIDDYAVENAKSVRTHLLNLGELLFRQDNACALRRFHLRKTRACQDDLLGGRGGN